VQSLLVNNGIYFPGGRAPRIALLPEDFEVAGSSPGRSASAAR
jgi:hypothetical protein